MFELFDDGMMRKMLCEAQMGLWTIEIEESKDPRMYADDKMLELLGLEEFQSPETCYNAWYDNILEKYRPMVNAAVDKIITTGEAEVEYPWNHNKWGEISVRCRGTKDESYQDGVRIRGYHQNINDTAILRREKEYLEELNDEILASLHEMFYSVIRFNLKTGEMTVLRADKGVWHDRELPDYQTYIDQMGDGTIHPEDKERVVEEFSIQNLRAVKQQNMDRYACDYRRNFDGKYRWVSRTAYFGKENFEDDWVIMVAQDVHEQKCMEEQSRFITTNAYETAQKASFAKSEFLSRMSHDMRTPMNAVKGMTTLALANLDDREQLRDYLEKIETSTDLMTQLIDEILDMSKIESGAYTLDEKPFKLAHLVENVCGMVKPSADKKGQDFTVSAEGVIHDNLTGDPLRIQQVLANVLSNAVKYTPAGGKICFTIEEFPSASKQSSTFCFKVKDNGIGMEPEFLEHIFEPFARSEDSRISKISGTGLGMAIAQSIVQLMGGVIQVQSERKKGSCFTIILPLGIQDDGREEDILSAGPKSEGIEDLHLEGKRILLVEDNEINREIAKAMLEMAGIEVEIAENGQVAVAMFETSAAGYYDMIFMDIQMPVMNGNQAAVFIRSLKRRDARIVPIVAMTANAFAEDIMQTKQSGMNEHLTKPVDVDKLAAVLRKWLE